MTRVVHPPIRIPDPDPDFLPIPHPESRILYPGVVKAPLLLLVNDVSRMSAVACIPSDDNSRAVACMRPPCFCLSVMFLVYPCTVTSPDKKIPLPRLNSIWSKKCFRHV